MNRNHHARTAPARSGDLKFAITRTSLGDTAVVASVVGIVSIVFGDSLEEMTCKIEAGFPGITAADADDVAIATALAYVDSTGEVADPPLDLRGTAFQKRVWAALRDIEIGKTASYSDIASRIGQPKASRAVARACAANRIAIAIPCHRVVRSDGAPAGFAWGPARREALLIRERANAGNSG